MTSNQTSSGGGLFSKLIVAVLLALAVGLYLRIVMVDGSNRYSAPPHQASVRIVEGSEPLRVTATQPLRDLPADQMALIRQVFAPELSE